MKKLLFAFFVFCSLQLTSGNLNWSFPADALSSDGQNAETPQVTIDPNGNAIAVWVESGLVKSKSKQANGGWDSIAATLSGLGASSPRIVADANGNAIAVWLENSVVKAASKSLNGNWSSSAALSSSNAASPCLAVDSTGNVIVAWARNGDVQTATKPFGANWKNPETINGTGSALPHIAIGGSGANTRAVVVWQGIDTSNNVVFAATKLSSGSWSNKQIISDSAHQAGYARAAVDSFGNAIAAWFSYDVVGSNYSNVIVQAATRQAAGNWSSPNALSQAGIRNPAALSLQLGFDASGNAIALWSNSYDSTAFTVQSAIKPASQPWGSPLDLVVDNLYSYSARLAVTSLGDALATYMFYNGAALLIQSAELDTTGFADAVWSVPLNLSQGNQNAFPAIAANVSGNSIKTAAVWIGGNGSTHSVFASTGQKTLIAPPSNLAVVQSSNNFNVFSEYYNTLNWTGSTDSSVTGYLVYRNGVFIGQVDASVLQFVDHNRSQNESVVYGVASINRFGEHGRIVTVSFP